LANTDRLKARMAFLAISSVRLHSTDEMLSEERGEIARLGDAELADVGHVQVEGRAGRGMKSGLRAILWRRAVKFVTTRLLLMQMSQDGPKAARWKLSHRCRRRRNASKSAGARGVADSSFFASAMVRVR
jgi:hypothetical protein